MFGVELLLMLAYLLFPQPKGQPPPALAGPTLSAIIEAAEWFAIGLIAGLEFSDGQAVTGWMLCFALAEHVIQLALGYRMASVVQEVLCFTMQTIFTTYAVLRARWAAVAIGIFGLCVHLLSIATGRPFLTVLRFGQLCGR